MPACFIQQGKTTVTTNNSTIAFIGLGIMGGPMALNLLRSGQKLRVYSRTKSRAAQVIKQGGAWTDSPAEAASGADIVFVCVTDTPDVEAVLLAPKGVIESARPGMIVVDHSTISPKATRTMAEKLAKKGATLIDAPISGGDVGAQNGTLSIMCGGDRTAFDRVEPLLRYMGRTITYCGESGSGQLTKLVNQILVSVTNMAVSEALLFAKQNGLDLTQTIAALGAARPVHGNWKTWARKWSTATSARGLRSISSRRICDWCLKRPSRRMCRSRRRASCTSCLRPHRPPGMASMARRRCSPSSKSYRRYTDYRGATTIDLRTGVRQAESSHA